MENSQLLLLGNEAVARAAYEAGATVATAYPGTPSTEITENIAKYNEIYCEWSPNEKVALEVAIGASIAGARAICSMKHVGLNVAADPLFTASYTGVNGGLVIVVADDPGMHSSQNEQDSRYYGLSARTPVLEPADSGECLKYVKLAFQISEDYDTPVIVRLTTRVAHSRSLAASSGRLERKLKDYVKDIGKYVMMPAMARVRHVLVEKRMAELTGYAETLPINAVAGPPTGAATAAAETDAAAGKKNELAMASDMTKHTLADKKNELAIITAGISWQYTREAMSDLGLIPGVHIPVLKLGLVYPLPEKLIAQFLSKTEKALIVEELSPFIENIIKTFGLRTKIIGKDALPAVGELSAALVRGAILAHCGPGQLPAAPQTEQPTTPSRTDQPIEQPPTERPAAQPQIDLPIRPPVFCPGCPHRSVFYILKKLKLIVCGDIGCYTLGALPPLQAMDACVCMGASIGMAHGFDKARGAPFSQKTVAVIGDSTFMHSGITGLLNIVYNKGCSTVMVLDNEITGMTGHQQNPSTGRTLRGEETRRADIAKLCEAIGVNNVRVEDPFDIAALEKAVKEELARPEPSVIIVRRPCAMLGSYKPEAAVRIDSGKCTRCKMCMGISCAAISDKDGVMQINQALCARCGLCATVCRFGAIVPLSETPGGDPDER